MEQQNLSDKDGYRWLKMTIEEAHHAFEATSAYKANFSVFKAKAINPAVKELTLKDGWFIEFTPIKKGRKVAILEFKFKKDDQLGFNF